MGWKSFAIVVNSEKAFNEAELLKDLGFENLKVSEPKSFHETLYPEEGKVYIGKYKGNLIICTQDLPLTFLEEKVSKGENVLAQHFPNTDISAFVLHSVVNLWGYSISRDSKKIRVKAGSADEGTMVDFGEPLEQELALFSKSKMDENGERIYFFKDYPDEPFTEDQVGENFVFALFERYFGKSMDCMEDEFFETELKGFDYSKQSNSSQTKSPNSSEEKPKSKKWNSIIFTVAIVIIWQILKRLVFRD